MDVFVVWDGDCDGDWIIGVFSDEAAANECAKYGGNLRITREEVLAAFTPPPDDGELQPTSGGCDAEVTVTHARTGRVETLRCHLPYGHSESHDWPRVQIDA